MPSGDEVGSGQVISYLPRSAQRGGSPELWAGVFLYMLRKDLSILLMYFPTCYSYLHSEREGVNVIVHCGHGTFWAQEVHILRQ